MNRGEFEEVTGSRHSPVRTETPVDERNKGPNSSHKSPMLSLATRNSVACCVPVAATPMFGRRFSNGFRRLRLEQIRRKYPSLDIGQEIDDACDSSAMGRPCSLGGYYGSFPSRMSFSRSTGVYSTRSSARQYRGLSSARLRAHS